MDWSLWAILSWLVVYLLLFGENEKMSGDSLRERLKDWVAIVVGAFAIIGTLIAVFSWVVKPHIKSLIDNALKEQAQQFSGQFEKLDNRMRGIDIQLSRIEGRLTARVDVKKLEKKIAVTTPQDRKAVGGYIQSIDLLTRKIQFQTLEGKTLQMSFAADMQSIISLDGKTKLVSLEDMQNAPQRAAVLVYGPINHSTSTAVHSINLVPFHLPKEFDNP